MTIPLYVGPEKYWKDIVCNEVDVLYSVNLNTYGGGGTLVGWLPGVRTQSVVFTIK
jgi:hypothetical protein